MNIEVAELCYEIIHCCTSHWGRQQFALAAHLPRTRSTLSEIYSDTVVQT